VRWLFLMPLNIVPASLWLRNCMDPLIIAGSAIAILREAMLAIEVGVQSGRISVDTQAGVLHKIDAIRAGNFSGPEWKVESSAQPDPTKPSL
jgi:hypothetical protein